MSKCQMKIFNIVLLGTVIFAPGAFAAKKKEKVEIATPVAVAQKTGDRYENITLFQKVVNFIEQNYVEEVKNKDLIYGAIKGMMETLDAHSNFLPPEIFKDMKSDTSGKFGGVGIEVGLKDSQLTVISPIEDTPAFRAGIKAGDRIVKISGESTKGLSLVEAIAKMRGKKGGEVNVTIWRKGWEKPKDFKLVREEIKIATVKSESLEPGYLYARLTNFNEHSSDDLKKSMVNFEKNSDKTDHKIKGMILDLRGNPGGLLDQAVDVSSLYIDEGAVVSTSGRSKDSKEVKYAKKGMARKDFPVAVLVNGSSASASEIVAGALQDHKRAVIMGQPTFGKGSVQTVVELQPDVGLKLTIARYYTPSGRSIQLKGIQPDVILDNFDQKVLDAAKKKGEAYREKDLKNHMSSDSDDDELIAENTPSEKPVEKDKSTDYKPFIAKEDYQVREALNYIKSYQIFRAAELTPSKFDPPTLAPEKIQDKVANGKAE